jgi:4-hydroxy-2-oxovalerate/4-hydroxy-2-oxohexanoate aldolase
MNLKGIRIQLCDMTLHDLMAVHLGQIKLDELTALACVLDAAGLPQIEIGTGLAAGPDSWWRGQASLELEACLRAIVPRLQHAHVALQITPGASAADQLRKARDWGVASVCFAAHWLDAALIAPYLGLAQRLGLDTVGVLMMAHETEVEHLVRQARLMEAEGANCVTLADSSGLMFSAELRERMQAMRSALDPATELGFHGHASAALAISNSLAAIEGGARRIEGSLTLPGLGHTAIDALCATCTRMGIETGVDAYRLADIGDGLVQPLLNALGPDRRVGRASPWALAEHRT